jgi:hypothetical protein
LEQARVIDLSTFDPRLVLLAVAIDYEAPAVARVAAAKALLQHSAGDQGDKLGASAPDPITKRALEIMAARRRAN